MNNTGEIYTPSGITSTLGASSVYRSGQLGMISGVSTQPSRAVRAIHQLSANTAQPIKTLRPSQRQKPIGASTEFFEASDALYLKIEAAFRTAKGEFFEDGMENTFSQQLNSFIKSYSNGALEAITCLIVYEKVDSEAAGEALRWLGRINHTESYEYRRWLLERSLSLSSSRLRDGAILGLASMDDKHAIPYLKVAIEKEQCFELKADMKQVLEQLES